MKLLEALEKVCTADKLRRSRVGSSVRVFAAFEKLAMYFLVCYSSFNNVGETF